MELKKFILNKKFILLNIFLTIYIITNLIGGERGLASYLKKKNIEKNLITKEKDLEIKIKDLEKKNSLLSNNIDFDFLDILLREKLKLGKKDEIIIQLN